MPSIYLQVAREVILRSGTAMSGHEILDYAYARRLFPPQLYGATQWKTLQAQLSEDILYRRDTSLFIRTEPGRFFLRELLKTGQAGASPEVFRARPRLLDLNVGRMLTLSHSLLKEWPQEQLSVEYFVDLLKEHGRFLTQREIESTSGTLKINTFVVVTKGSHILSYRMGRYRSHKDTMLLPKSIGFGGPVREVDYDLLDTNTMGIVNSGLREISAVLGMSSHVVRLATQDGLLIPLYILKTPESEAADAVQAVLVFKCPPTYEPTRRRLAINDLRWTHLLELPNDVDDIEPISRTVLRSKNFRMMLEDA